MGCDIHMFAEKRADANSNWEQIGKVFKNPYYSEDRESTVDEDGYEWNAKFTNQPYKGRNYNLFSILADVRNGYGFAGVKTGEGFIPIAQPKGIPSDVSEGVMKENGVMVDEDTSFEQLKTWVEKGYSEWIKYGESATGPDWHSESWFTVKELLDYDWNQVTMHRGVINLNQYKECKEKSLSFPEGGWSGGVSGGNIVTVDEDVADGILAGERPPELVGKNIYVNSHWGALYKDSCETFLNETIPTLLEFGNPEDVRIVFWFDN